jgi:hypothetical protein
MWEAKLDWSTVPCAGMLPTFASTCSVYSPRKHSGRRHGCGAFSPISSKLPEPFPRRRSLRDARARLTDTLVISGGETDVFVLAVLGAGDLGYRVVLATDALCSSSDETHDALLTSYESRFSEQIEGFRQVRFWRMGNDYPDHVWTQLFEALSGSSRVTASQSANSSFISRNAHKSTGAAVAAFQIGA